MIDSTIAVGSISQGSKMALGVRFIHTDRIPLETAPITSNGLLEISHDFETIDSVLRMSGFYR